MDNILIIDDEKYIRMGLRKIIEDSGIQYQKIVECRNGRQALEALELDNFDVIFTDIRMPVMDGIEFIKKMNEYKCEADIVVLSGYDEFNYAVHTFKYGARDYLLKPIERDVLIQLLSKIAAEREEKENALKQQKLETQRMQQIEKNYNEAVSALTFTALNQNDSAHERPTHKRGLDINPQMEKALRYIEQNYENKLNMAIVSNYVSVSYSFFSETFKEYVGVNFRTYLKTVRIKKAKELLANTELRIGEIAREVGIYDEKLFMKNFKQVTKLSPTEYRKYAKIHVFLDNEC